MMFTRTRLAVLVSLLVVACSGGGDGGGGGGGGGVPPASGSGGGSGGGSGSGSGDGDGGNGGGGDGDGDGGGLTIIDPIPAARGLLPSIARADDTFEGTHHTGSGVCSDCHNNENMVVPTESGTPKNVSIGTAWRTSVMANSTRDPYWHAVVAWELDEFPMLEDEINDKCTVCHAPMAHDVAEKEGIDLRLFDTGSAAEGTLASGIYSGDASDELFNHAMDGVSCSMCHQIDGGNLGTDSSFTGGYEIVDARNLPNKPAYGQYDDPDSGYMLAQTGFLAQGGPHLSTSETCATCHNLNVAPVDADGETIPGIDHFAEQANYTEWLFSDYRAGGALEASCQDCHMPVLDRPVVLAAGSSNMPRDGFAEHTFLGANTVMQTMFRDFSEELGLPEDITEADWNASIERNRAFLQTAASVTLGNASRTDLPPDASADRAFEELGFDVDVVNETGHKLPTGYHSRRVWLHVLITGEEGVVWESGAIDAEGRIAGLSEDVNPKSHEVHYDRITDASQVQVYQSVVGDNDNQRTSSLLAGDRYLKDNRIVPKGFDKQAVAADPTVLDSFGTFGAAMQDEDFDSGRDTVSYQVRVPAGGDYRVLVELRYQPLAYGHLQEVFAKSGDIDVIDKFRTVYESTSLRAETIATAVATVPR